MQEHDELEEFAAGQQPQKEKDKAGLLSKALRAPLGTRTLSLHNLLDQAPFLEGQQVCNQLPIHDVTSCLYMLLTCDCCMQHAKHAAEVAQSCSNNVWWVSLLMFISEYMRLSEHGINLT